MKMKILQFCYYDNIKKNHFNFMLCMDFSVTIAKTFQIVIAQGSFKNLKNSYDAKIYLVGYHPRAQGELSLSDIV